jgi:hypothetical protein
LTTRPKLPDPISCPFYSNENYFIFWGNLFIKYIKEQQTES